MFAAGQFSAMLMLSTVAFDAAVVDQSNSEGIGFPYEKSRLCLGGLGVVCGGMNHATQVFIVTFANGVIVSVFGWLIALRKARRETAAQRPYQTSKSFLLGRYLGRFARKLVKKRQG